MITSDYIKGYISALDNIITFCDNVQKDKDYNFIKNISIVKDYIKQSRANYKNLVKELNETQSKKTTP